MDNNNYNKIPSFKRHSKEKHSKGKTSKVNPQKGTNYNNSVRRSSTRKIAFNNRKPEKKESLVENLLRTIREDEEKLAKIYAELAKARQERYYEMKKSSNLSREQLNKDILGDY